MKWITLRQFVDLETGEVLHQITEGYSIVKKISRTTYVKNNEKRKFGFTTITYGIRKKNAQGKLFD